MGEPVKQDPQESSSSGIADTVPLVHPSPDDLEALSSVAESLPVAIGPLLRNRRPCRAPRRLFRECAPQDKVASPAPPFSLACTSDPSSSRRQSHQTRNPTAPYRRSFPAAISCLAGCLRGWQAAARKSAVAQRSESVPPALAAWRVLVA
jgi:hypothetical protein